MKQKNPKFYHKLFFHIYLYFAIILILFSIVLSVIYVQWYRRNSLESYSNLLGKQVDNISDRLSEFVNTKDLTDYPTYLEMLEVTMSADIWIISNPNSSEPMSDEMVNVEYKKKDLGPQVVKIIDEAFIGDSGSATAYNKIYKEKRLNIASPVYNENQDIVGCVLLIAPIESEHESIRNAGLLFIASTLASLLISFLVAIKFAKIISDPVAKLSSTALVLSEGKYSERTKIKRPDEIGQLARTFDILASKLEENEKQRNTMEQMRMDFFANVSHELKTPITVLRGYVECLVDGVVDDPNKVMQYYNRMLVECKGMDRLIQDLLLLAKMENPQFKMNMEPIELSQVLDDVIRSAKVICLEKNITIHFEKEEQLYFIEGDYDRLKQMFMKILDNAIKFSENNKNVYIKVEKMDKINVYIKDEGVGMTDEELGKIFAKFYTSKISNNKDGTGLGLMIAKEIALKHNGTINVTSEKGQGTCFQFTFDAIEVEEEL